MADGEYTDGSETETERGWFQEPRPNGAPLAEPIGSVARSGQLGAPLGIAHLALGAVSAAMSAFSPGRGGKGEGDGLPRVRMLSCLHALFTQLHDIDQPDTPPAAEENGRHQNQQQSQHRGPPLEHTELDILEKAVRILHLRYRSCLRPLTKGRLPSRTELKELRGSAEALNVRATALCLDKVPKGDRRRLPLFAFKTFALRAELDAEALRNLQEPEGPEWDIGSYCVATERLRGLLEDMADEMEALWESGPRTLYDVGVVLAPILAQYALLGKAVALALEQCTARLTVRKHGRVIYAVGDEIILWDDGLDEVRQMFYGERGSYGGGGDRPLGATIRIDSMQDYSWFVSWNGTSPVDSIPSEVPVKKLLVCIGAPPGRMSGLRQGDKPHLMSMALPSVRQEAEQRIEVQLQWAVDQGAKFELRPGRPGTGGQSGSSDLPLVGVLADSSPGASASTTPRGTTSKKTQQVLQRRALSPQMVETILDSSFLEDPTEPAKSMSFEMILSATQNWDEGMKLGEGGSAVVYKGLSPDGQLWAVKRGKKGGLTRLKDYEKEIAAVSNMNHPNLVRLLGFCDENDEQVLVYEYVPNGTLRDHLNPVQGNGESEMLLAFEKRLEIAVGVADGLYYLHSSKPALVHRDVKSLNVFMDADFQPKLGDFGSLKHIGDDLGSQTLTRVVGTPGYLDPQYCQTSIVSDRSDVYSFGVVLLELITGKPPVMKEGEDGTGERMALAKWATPAICSGNTDSIVDPRLLGHIFHPGPLQALASLAAMCVQRQPKDRPGMGEVARRLKSIRAQAMAMLPPSPLTPQRGPSGGRRRPSPLPGIHPHHSQQYLQALSQPHGLAQHMTAPLSPHAFPPSALVHSASTPESPHPGSSSSASQKSLFNKDFWRPKRAPARSLSDASMQDIADYLDTDPDSGPIAASSPVLGTSSTASTPSLPSTGQQQLTQKEYMPPPRSSLGPFRSFTSSNASAPFVNHSSTGGYGIPHSQPLMIPKTKSADGPTVIAAHHHRSSSSSGGLVAGQFLTSVSLHQSNNSSSRFGRKAGRMKEALMFLAKLQHGNVAPVVGLAAEPRGGDPVPEGGPLLVYDLPAHCTPLLSYLIPEELEEDEEDEALPLRIRLKVAVGVARGLGFLHASGVVHGNLHPSNIMLDRNFSVLLSGYGQTFVLQRSSSRKVNHLSAAAMARDTFDYGVVLYELLTGRRRCDLSRTNNPADYLTDWAEPFIEELKASMGGGSEQPAKRMVLQMLDVLAKECVQDDPHCRPSMKDLMVRLQGLQESLTAQ